VGDGRQRQAAVGRILPCVVQLVRLLEVDQGGVQVAAVVAEEADLQQRVRLELAVLDAQRVLVGGQVVASGFLQPAGVLESIAAARQQLPMEFQILRAHRLGQPGVRGRQRHLRIRRQPALLLQHAGPMVRRGRGHAQHFVDEAHGRRGIDLLQPVGFGHERTGIARRGRGRG
jgi:hypothetical protein